MFCEELNLDFERALFKFTSVQSEFLFFKQPLMMQHLKGLLHSGQVFMAVFIAKTLLLSIVE